MTGYRLLFDHVLARTDPERAHHVGFRAIRTAGPALAAASALAARAGREQGVRRCRPSG